MSDEHPDPDLIPANLFKNAVRNDRYVVYRMLHRMVSFIHPTTKEKVSGYVDEVYRDVFAGELHITIDGTVYRFKEPEVIRENQKEFVFLYGDVGKREVSDERLFDAMRQRQYQESLDATIQRTTHDKVHETRFKIGERKPARRKPFLWRGIDPEIAASLRGE